MKTFDARSRFESVARSPEHQPVPMVLPCGRKHRPAPTPSSLLGLLCSVFCLLSFVPAARAQWQNATFSLTGGWNSIYLHGDATYATPDVLFADHPEILEVWRWNPNPNPAQINGSSLVPSASSPEWSMWIRGQPTQSTLSKLPGQTAYLVKCSGTTADHYSLILNQQILPPRSTWVRNGANLLGFPTKADPSYPFFSNYFSTFPAAIATNTKIYKYVGGDIGPGNPVQVFSPTTERLDRNQAYWFEAAVVGDFYAPLEISPSDLKGLNYGRNGALFTVRVRNRTAAPVTLTIAPVESASAPVGQEPVLARVPITRRTFDAANNSYSETLIGTSYTEVIAPQTSVELSYGIDRAQMTGAVGALYASFLRFTDSGNLMDVLLPASARVTSYAGLWVGDVAVTDVANKSPVRTYTCQVTNAKATLESRAAALGTTSLRVISLPPGGGPYTYQWRKAGVPVSGGANSTLVLSEAEAAEIDLAGSGTARAFSLRILLHVDDAGTARLLSQVYLGTLAASPAGPAGLTIDERFLKSDAKATAMRLVATHLPLDAVITSGSGGVTPGGDPLVRTIQIPFDDATNPFVHQFHPDHDNKDERGVALPRLVKDANGNYVPNPRAESYTINRTFTFQFLAGAPAGTSKLGWGASVIGGIYSETVTGLHKDPISVQGTFRLNRISEISSITLN